jgi:release factor glutamine methyltransferase
MDDSNVNLEIYEPREDSFILQKQVKEHAFGKVLDIGTGSGIQALTAKDLSSVKSVTAIDINPNAIKKLKEKISIKNNNSIKGLSSLKKLKSFNAFESNLFENVNVTGKFDTIIFNPPYLPQDVIGDTIIDDMALYGGKFGWEIIELFLKGASNYLNSNGIILLLFSSLTNKEKVDSLIDLNLFEKELLIEEKMPMFETLYVYKITANKIKEMLISRGIKNVNYLSKGRRGLVFKGKWDKNSIIKSHIAKENIIDVVIKITNPDSSAQNRIVNEAKWLVKVNKIQIGPKLYFYDEKNESFIVEEFILGKHFPAFVKEFGKNSKEVKSVILQLLNQCRKLDLLYVDKEEMTRPLKNVLVTKENGQYKVCLLDFERCSSTPNPQNVSQFCSFLVHHNYINKEKGIKLSKEYKQTYSDDAFEEILTNLC